MPKAARASFCIRPGPSAPQGRGPAPATTPTHAAPRAQVTSAPTGNGTATALARAPETSLARYASFPAVIELIRANRDVKLLLEVENHVRLVHYAPGRIEFEPAADAPRDLAATLAQRLQSWTGVRWGVSVVSEGGAATIAEERSAKEDAAKAKAKDNPLVQAVFAAFPNAHITAIRTPDEVQAEVQAEALPEVEDEWDPFEDN